MNLTTDYDANYASNFDRLLMFCDQMYDQQQESIYKPELFPTSVSLLFMHYGYLRISIYLQSLNNLALDDFDLYKQMWEDACLPMPDVQMMNAINSFLHNPIDFWER